jgi:Chromo (CHRromatin Organisation MOdifier) domain
MFIAKKTKISPAYTTYKYNPEVYCSAIISEVNNQTTSLQVLDLKVFHEELAVDLVFFTKRIVSYYDRYYNIEPTLKKGDKIYLIQQNIQTKQPNTKLDHKKLGLFKIKRIIGPINYKLVLPKTINIYLVFYISLLELALPGVLLVPVTEIELVNPNMEYKVEEILDHKQVKNCIKYLVKWTDYLYSENTWETKIILKNLEKFIEYQNQHPDLTREDPGDYSSRTKQQN